MAKKRIVVGLVLGLAGCGEAHDEELGSAELELVQVPPGVKCIHVVVDTVVKSFEKSFSVTPGSIASLSFGKLPAGPATFVGEAYDKACPNDHDPPNKPATWLADPVSVELVAGLPTPIRLDFWRSVPTDGTAEFHESASLLTMGPHTVYAVAVDGTVYAWGRGDHGQLGTGTSSPPALSPLVVPGVVAPTGIAGGFLHACAWKGADVWCWGHGASGALGVGQLPPTTTILPPSQVARPWSGEVLTVVTGSGFTCALVSPGDVYCWGENEDGVLGQGDLVDRHLPTRLPGGLPATQYIDLWAGLDGVCAMTSHRNVHCWGANSFGLLLPGAPPQHLTRPELNSPLHATDKLSFLVNHGCQLRADGAVLCWAHNGQGQLGHGNETSQSPLAPVIGLPAAVDVAAGWMHSCAVRSSGEAVCWGDNGVGQIGDGTGLRSLTPAAVRGLDDATTIVAGMASTCALRVGGKIACWGSNSFGELGDGTGVTAHVPVDVDLVP